MHSSNSKIAQWQIWASIVASVISSLIVGYFGWKVQGDLSARSLKKDYFHMAVEIASKPETPNETSDEKSLQSWARLILKKYSPVPFNSPSTKHPPASNSPTETNSIPFTLLSSPLMAPPKRWKYLPKNKPVTNGDLLKNYIYNHMLFKENALELKYLQQVVHEMAAASNKADLEPSKTDK